MNQLEKNFQAVLNQAISSEDPLIYYKLGRLYEIGLGTYPSDNDKAKIWYDKALNQINLIQLQADNGDAVGQFIWGRIHAHGQSTTRDYAVALEWYRKAAKQGHANAQCSVGNAYYYGHSVERDCKEAVKWYRMAAEQGDACGQYNLGLMYSKGIGVEQDEEEAEKWFLEAKKQGYRFATFKLKLLITPSSLKRREEEIEKCRKDLAEGRNKNIYPPEAIARSLDHQERRLKLDKGLLKEKQLARQQADQQKDSSTRP